MPKGDTWPGSVAVESSNNMDSAGSCDSVISTNSGYSADSMEHLSAEERACLMYLEETIEALEVQEDSGLSDDEAEPLSVAEKLLQIRLEDVTTLVPEPERTIVEDEAECGADSEAVQPVAEQQAAAPQAKTLCLLKDENGKMKIVSNQPAQEPEVDLSMIPPPSDFMDEPKPRGTPEPPEPPRSDRGPQTVDLQELCRRASAKVAEELPADPTESSAHVSPHVTPTPPSTPPPEAPEPKSPPAVAPKPKRLPANILLKSHRAAAAPSVSEGGSGLPLLPDPQRVHMEALRKLGLLKSEETDLGPALSPRLSPQTRRSWAASSPPVSPRTPPATPSHSRLSAPPPPSVLPQATATPPSDPPPFIVPAPAAFSDSEGPSRTERGAAAASKALSNTPPRSTLALIKQLTPPRIKGPRSATVERSGSGSSGCAARRDPGEVSQDGGDKWSPNQLRNTRPRPASLGSREEFAGSTKGGAAQVGRASGKEPDSRRSLPAAQPSGNSPKLPRSQGISVVICPRSENGDQRREALRRLGLLRD